MIYHRICISLKIRSNLLKHPIHLAKFFSILLCLFILSACETAQREDIVVTPMPEDSPNVLVRQPVTTMGQQNYGSLPNYDYQITNASNGDVTVYSLDGAEPAITPRIEPNMSPAPVMAMPIGNNYQPRANNRYNPQMAMGNGRVDEQIFFKFGSSRLGSIDEQKISSFADAAKFAPINRVTIEGYASARTQAGVGTVESHILNLKESMNRSFAVSKSLMRNGLPAEKIKTVSYGSTMATGNDPQDRRVDMIMGER